MKNEAILEMFERLELTSNVMRGMSLDPAIPTHVREILLEYALGTEKITDKYLPEVEEME